MYQILIKAFAPLAMVLLLAVMACGGEAAPPTPVGVTRVAAPAATTAPAAEAPAATTAAPEATTAPAAPAGKRGPQGQRGPRPPRRNSQLSWRPSPNNPRDSTPSAAPLPSMTPPTT